MTTPQQSRGYRNRNPGNIAFEKPNQWVGQIGLGDEWLPKPQRRLAAFDRPENGIRALATILLGYQSIYGISTIEAVVSRWAARSRSNPAAYLATVTRMTGFGAADQRDLLLHANLRPLVDAVIANEIGGQPYASSVIDTALLGVGVLQALVSSGAPPAVVDATPTPPPSVPEHTHDPDEIAGLDDYLSSVVGGLLVEGLGIDLTQDSITGAITIEASGGGGGVAVRDEGVTLTGAAGFLDFVGAGVAATTVSGGVQVSIPGAAGGGSAEGRAHVVPSLSAFSWVNQGSATATQQSYGISAKQPNVSGDSLAMLVQSAPTPPYEVRARFRIVRQFMQYHQVGALWRDSSSGKLCSLHTYGNNGTLFVAAANWNSPTSYNAGIAGAWAAEPTTAWLRLKDDNTNRSVAVSADGDEWSAIWSGSRTSFLTPNQIGWFMDANGSANFPLGATLLSWEVLT